MSNLSRIIGLSSRKATCSNWTSGHHAVCPSSSKSISSASTDFDINNWTVPIKKLSTKTNEELNSKENSAQKCETVSSLDKFDWKQSIKNVTLQSQNLLTRKLFRQNASMFANYRHNLFGYGIREFRTSSMLRWDRYENKNFLERGEDIVRRTIQGLAFDLPRFKRRMQEAKDDVYRRKGQLGYTKKAVQRWELLPYDSDFLILGGGIMGSAMAWWLKQRIRDEDLLVTVVEDDDKFAQTSTIRGLGGIRTQFSMPEYVEMSVLSAEFIRNVGEILRITDSEPPDINFVPMGYLFLATNEDEAKQMEESWKMQSLFGAKVALLNKDSLEQKFPFMKFDDVLLGSIGLENEGIFDGWQLLSAFREKNITLGVQYVKARIEKLFLEEAAKDMPMRSRFYDATDAVWRTRLVRGVYVVPQKSDSTPRPMRGFKVINCTGAWAGKLAETGGIGKGTDIMSVPIPIQPRKRYVFVVHCPEGPGLDMPFLNDPTGVWCHREDYGHTYYCGKEPTLEEDSKIDHSNLDVDYDYFYDKVWPVLARRIPAFQHLKIKNAWAGYYDVNTYDQHPIIGPHLAYDSFYQAAGFGSHGFQHAISVGKGAMEFFDDGAYKTVNLRKFGMQRLLTKEKLREDYDFQGY